MRMADSGKEASSTTDLRKKSTLLDADIGDEFLNSWKSISVAKDDTLDLCFGTVSKSKNKAFDFGALDDDFNLGGSFEKLSSFKLDMPDLDFSCLSQKTSKAMGSCQEESPKKNREKKLDSLNFSFDFKELDSFDVDSSLENGERTCKPKQDTEATSSRVECEGSAIHIADESTTIDNRITKKLSALDNETSSKHEFFGGDNSELEPEVADGMPDEARNVVDSTNEKAKEPFENSCLTEIQLSKSTHQSIHYIAPQFIGRKNVPECIPDELCKPVVEPSEAPGGNENVANAIIDTGGTCCKSLHQNNLSPINLPVPESNCAESDKSGCSPLNDSVENVQMDEGDVDLKDNLNPDVSKKLLVNTQNFRENQISKLQLPTVPLCREPLNRMTGKENGISGNVSKRGTDIVGKPQHHQSSSIVKKLFSLGNNRTDDLNQNPATATGECSNNVQNASNSCEDTLPHKKVANSAPPIVLNGEKSLVELTALSAAVYPSNSCVKTNTQTLCHSEHPKLLMMHSRSSKITSAQESKLCSIKTSPEVFNRSSLKISRNLALYSVGSEKEKKLGNSEQIMGAGQRRKALDIGHPAENAEKPKLLVSSLKRKTLEASNADSKLVKPLKRLSVSSSGFRDPHISSEKKIDDQVGSKITTASYDQLDSTIETAHVPHTMELEISLVLENDRNVEKSEAYMKELDVICNMLKKKHDEAKEVLVRAIVNNNNLLVLNHPIYEKKIRMVEKFAAKLLSKELQTKAA